ncbi:hypothetical protein HYS54_03555 [Candidatus Micrarchaeota archaeon]|nr:hypothetical protein [Candidatus Micrarchaeota archaeon]
MNADSSIILFLVLLAIGAFYIKLVWLAAILGAVALLYALSASRPKRSPVPGGGGAQVRVQPIVMQRKYAGPESIYPGLMKVYARKTPTGTQWWEYGLEAPGRAVKSGLGWLRDKLS